MIDIRVISQNNKTLEIINLDQTVEMINVSNENIPMACDSYCIYVSPDVTDITYTSFLSLGHEVLTSFYSISFIIIIIAMFIIFLKGSKRFFK